MSVSEIIIPTLTLPTEDGEPFGQKLGGEEIVERRDQKTLGKVTSGAKEDERAGR